MEGKIEVPDWAYLNKYKYENTLITAQSLVQKLIVFFGDSIIAGWEIIYPEFFVNKTYINRGINSQTTSQMLIRFRQDVIELKPKIVVILAGTNDIAGNKGYVTLETILENLISMCESAKANHIKIILCSVLPAYDYPWKPGQEPAGKIETLNGMIQKYAIASDIMYVNCYSEMVDNRKGLKVIYSEDGVHPNKAGYQVMAPLIEKAIEKL